MTRKVYLARKVTRAKWEALYGVADGEIPADAVSADLRTSKNSLSFWHCGEATPNEIEDVVLALAAMHERHDKVEVVWVAENKLATNNLEVNESEGNTPVKSLKMRHRDATALDYVRLGKIAHIMADSIDNDRFRRFTRKEVIEIIKAAINEGRISKNDLQKKVRQVLDAPHSLPPVLA